VTGGGVDDADRRAPDDGYFAEPVAATYDVESADMFEPDVVGPAVDLLAGLAGDGRALELGIGTGRIAIPLAARGIEVAGIELSRAMAARLRAKPGGETIAVTIGDFASATADGTFRVAYLVFNTIMNLTTQGTQVECFRNVARHLEPGGTFVIEVMIPRLRWLPPGQTIHPFHVGDTTFGFDEYDLATQGLVSNHVDVTDGRGDRFSIPFRYVWPAELDLMAQLAGMRLRDRWAGWRGEPFTGESLQHVSVWEMPGAPAQIRKASPLR
jgi:SAM-dependent methyltransferase